MFRSRPAETPKVGVSRVCVKASPAFGRRRLHTNTDSIVLASAAARLTPLALKKKKKKKEKKKVQREIGAKIDRFSRGGGVQI